MEALQFRHSAKLADSADCMQCIACRHRGGESPPVVVFGGRWTLVKIVRAIP